MTEQVNLPALLFEQAIWKKETNPIWIATTFTLHRNLTKYLFPPKLTPIQLQQTCILLSETLCKIQPLQHPIFFNAESISSLDKEFLFEHFLCLEGFQNTFNHQGFILDDSSQFFAKINIDNHLQMHWVDTTGNGEDAWNKLSKIDTLIGDTIEFAFSPRFGYLTSDPTFCGTGLVMHAFLHVPALIHMHQLEEALSKQSEEGTTFFGMGGTLDEIVGDLLVISNTYTLGENEESVLHNLHSTVMKFMALEKTLRSHLMAGNNPEIKDLISRAFGLLLHSYQLQTKEALAALSLMKLGLHLDWIEGLSNEKINALFFLSRRAHLLHHLKETALTDSQDIAFKRAEFLHKNMQGVSLKFETKL